MALTTRRNQEGWGLEALGRAGEGREGGGSVQWRGKETTATSFCPCSRVNRMLTGRLP